MKVIFTIDIKESEKDEISLVISKPEDEELQKLLEWINELIKIDITEKDGNWILQGDDFKQIAIVLSILTAINQEIINMYCFNEYGLDMITESLETLFDAKNQPIKRPSKSKKTNGHKIQMPSIFDQEEIKELKKEEKKT